MMYMCDCFKMCRQSDCEEDGSHEDGYDEDGGDGRFEMIRPCAAIKAIHFLKLEERETIIFN